MQRKKGRKYSQTSSEYHSRKKNPVGFNPAKEPVEPDVEVVGENDDEDKNIKATSKSTPAQEKLELEKKCSSRYRKAKRCQSFGVQQRKCCQYEQKNQGT